MSKMGLNTLIGECTAYDFKLMLEERKPKSWLKSVSAFANGLGGSLFFGVDDKGMLLREAMNFVKSNTKRGWEKLPDGRKNKPEYAERAVLEAMFNHFIHRDYTAMGGQVHLDIYDDRLVVTSPGGMYNGLFIQDLDIVDVSSERRNPIFANVMVQLDYMEKRGGGLTRICNETKSLKGYRDDLQPVFKSTPAQFQTAIFTFTDMTDVGDMSNMKLSERQQKTLNLIKESPTISGRQMSEILSVSQRTVERDLAMLKKWKFSSARARIMQESGF